MAENINNSNICLKKGSLEGLPNTSIENGTIYFAKNKEVQGKSYDYVGELFYDDNDTRIKISPSIENFSYFYADDKTVNNIVEKPNLINELVLEDGQSFVNQIPFADVVFDTDSDGKPFIKEKQAGILSISSQYIAGNKNFIDSISAKKITLTNEEEGQIVLTRSNYNYITASKNSGICFAFTDETPALASSALVIQSIVEDNNQESFVVLSRTKANLGSLNHPWNELHATQPYIHGEKGKIQLLNALTTNTNITLTLPKESGYIVGAPINGIGSATNPVYINSNGKAVACGKNLNDYLSKSQGGTVEGTVTFNNPIKFNTESYGTAFPTGTAGQLYLLEDDGLLKTTNFGSTDPNSSTPGYNVEGALYFKILPA